MKKPHETKFDNTWTPLFTYDDSKILLDGKTDLFSSGVQEIDEFIGGGYGLAGDFETLLIFGEVKKSKSTVALNFLKNPIQQGKRVGLFIGEERYEKIKKMLRLICGDEHILANQNIWTHKTQQEERWTLGDLVVAIDSWFHYCDVILVDTLQSFFNKSYAEDRRDKWSDHQRFMDDLAHIGLKHAGKAIILVSHVSKDKSSNNSNMIQGSHSIRENATKIIEVYDDKEDGRLQKYLRMWESRYTKNDNYGESLPIYLDYPRLVSASEWEKLNGRGWL